MKAFNNFSVLNFLKWLFRLIFKKPKKRYKRKTAHRHTKNINTASRVLKRTNGFELPQMLNYLRQIDAYVFEELLLTAFKEKGYQISRNKSYSGDGGLDGMIHRDGKTYLVQAKRYDSLIKNKHVIEFCRLVSTKHVHGGFFVHTGKTPYAAWNSIKNTNVKIISGKKLVSLIN